MLVNNRSETNGFYIGGFWLNEICYQNEVNGEIPPIPRRFHFVSDNLIDSMQDKSYAAPLNYSICSITSNLDHLCQSSCIIKCHQIQFFLTEVISHCTSYSEECTAEFLTQEKCHIAL